MELPQQKLTEIETLLHRKIISVLFELDILRIFSKSPSLEIDQLLFWVPGAFCLCLCRGPL